MSLWQVAAGLRKPILSQRKYKKPLVCCDPKEKICYTFIAHEVFQQLNKTWSKLLEFKPLDGVRDPCESNNELNHFKVFFKLLFSVMAGSPLWY